MRNKDILNLHTQLDIELRLSLYKEAVELIKSEEIKYGLNDNGHYQLCLLMPCLLWDIDYLDMSPSSNGWYCNESKTAFPELKWWVNNSYSISKNDEALVLQGLIPRTNSNRIEYLEKVITVLETQIADKINNSNNQI